MLIELTDTADSRNMLMATAVFGAVGGLIGQMLTSWDRTPAPANWKTYLAPPMGWFTNPLIGAAAAIIALYILAPITSTTVTEAADGTTTTRHYYDLIRLAGMSVLVGASGGAFVAAAKARVLAAVSEGAAEMTKSVAATTAEEIGKKAKQAAEQVIKQRLSTAIPQIRRVLEDASESAPEGLTKGLEEQGLLYNGTLNISRQPQAGADAAGTFSIEYPIPVDRVGLIDRMDSILGQVADDVAATVGTRVDQEVASAKTIIASI